VAVDETSVSFSCVRDGMMADFFASGRVADLILLVLAAEALLLLAWRRRTGRGLPRWRWPGWFCPAWPWCWRCARR
jgi:hypothetical protein